MKTPEEIKRALECCAEISVCSECPYYKPDSACVETKSMDSLAYIQQLEAERDAAAKIIYDAIAYLEELGSPRYALMQLKKMECAAEV